MKFDGVYVATITPFLESGELCLEKYAEHLNFLAESKVQGIVACATTGEGPVLTATERAQILKVSKEICAKNSLKFIAGCNSNSTQIVHEQLIEAKEVGCDAALVITPYYNKPTQKGVVTHFEFLANKELLPIIIYNNPSRTNILLSLESSQILFQHPFISGLKESSGNYSHWLGLAQLPCWKEKSWLAGDDDAFALTMMLGGSGIIATAANIVPKLFSKIYEFCKEKQYEEAFKAQVQLVPFLKTLFSETNPSPLKYALRKFKNYNAYVRMPLVEVEKETAQKIEKEWSLLCP
jgi:4-hydroxy-tetrahydrodipicolinate synthase